MNMPTLICLDTETTGVNISVDKPIQVGLVYVDNEGSRHVLMNCLANPEMPIAKEASEINKITDRMVSAMPSYRLVCWQMMNMIRAYNPDFLVTFNGSMFDIPLLNNCLQEGNKLSIPGIDVLDLAYRYLQGQTSYKLGLVHASLFGKEHDSAHDAIADIHATLNILFELKKKLGWTLEQIAEDLAVPKPYHIFPISKNHRGKLLSEVPKGFAIWLLDKEKESPLRPDLKLSLKMIVDGTA